MAPLFSRRRPHAPTACDDLEKNQKQAVLLVISSFSLALLWDKQIWPNAECIMGFGFGETRLRSHPSVAQGKQSLVAPALALVVVCRRRLTVGRSFGRVIYCPSEVSGVWPTFRRPLSGRLVVVVVGPLVGRRVSHCIVRCGVANSVRDSSISDGHTTNRSNIETQCRL